MDGIPFSFVSYNVRGLCAGQSERDRVCRVIVDKILRACDILCVKETFFLAKKDFERLNCTHEDFYGAGESTTDLNTKHVKGRIPG